MSNSEFETDQQFKKRVLDPAGPAFCAAKWYNATIWLNNGWTASCHHPAAHAIDTNALRENPAALHNTVQKKLARGQMLAGVRPPECDYCWRLEDLDANAVSDRVYKTRVYSDEEITALIGSDPSAEIDPITLEIAFDRKCNLACAYCNPSFSSRWVKDIRSNGIYSSLGREASRHYGHLHESPWDDSEGQSPYEAAFWRWLDGGLLESLKQLRITGGEPLLHRQVWRILEIFCGDDRAREIRLAINSNLSVPKDLMDRLFEYGRQVGDLHLYTSNECMGERAEYLRDGLSWDLWARNVERVCAGEAFSGFHIMCTVNALCLYGLADFLSYVVRLKREYGRGRAAFTLNILRVPRFDSVEVLPVDMRENRAAEFERWIERYGAEILEFERNHVTRLISYLRKPSLPSTVLLSLQRDFRSFYSQYDIRRLKRFHSTWPSSIVDWFRRLPVAGHHKCPPNGHE